MPLDPRLDDVPWSDLGAPEVPELLDRLGADPEAGGGDEVREALERALLGEDLRITPVAEAALPFLVRGLRRSRVRRRGPVLELLGEVLAADPEHLDHPERATSPGEVRDAFLRYLRVQELRREAWPRVIDLATDPDEPDRVVAIELLGSDPALAMAVAPALRVALPLAPPEVQRTTIHTLTCLVPQLTPGERVLWVAALVRLVSLRRGVGDTARFAIPTFLHPRGGPRLDERRLEELFLRLDERGREVVHGAL